MSEGELRGEAYARLERKFERMGIHQPDEELSQSELREMYGEELRRAYEQHEERSFLG